MAVLGEKVFSSVEMLRTSFVTDDSGEPGGVVTGSEAVQPPPSLPLEHDVSRTRNGHGDSDAPFVVDCALFEASWVMLQLPLGERLCPMMSELCDAPALVASCATP